MRARRLIFCVLTLTVGCIFPVALLAVAEPKAAAPVAAPGGDIIYPRAASTPSPGTMPTSGSSGATGLLITALALAAAGGWLYWRARRLPGSTVPVRHLTIAETKSLGNRQYLVVASYQDKKFLLGVCPGRIDLLTPLNTEASDRQP